MKRVHFILILLAAVAGLVVGLYAITSSLADSTDDPETVQLELAYTETDFHGLADATSHDDAEDHSISEDVHSADEQGGGHNTNTMARAANREHAASAEEVGAGDDAHDDDGDDHAAEVAAAVEADAHGHDGTSGGDEDGVSASVADDHGHAEPQIGYMGTTERAPIEEEELNLFVERVQEEAYQKGELDQIRFVAMGVGFLLVYLAFAKIKVGNLSERLRNAIDWHTLGTVSGIILVLLVIPSGILITFFYMPTSTQAYTSVANMADQPVLAFFRNLHNWSSEVFIFLSLLHAARTVSTKTFLSKRKLIWALGALALVVGWVAFLSGTFMRGDQEALEGFEHMMYSFTLVPLGKVIADFFSGEYTLMKLTTLHIGVTIFIIVLTLTLHVLMRKVHVLVTRRWKKALTYSVALTLLLVAQSLFMEAPFIRGTASGPTVSGIEATKPPWPLYFMIQGENWFGANSMVAILALAFIPLIIFPYAVEFLPLSPARKARLGEGLFYAGVLVMLVVSFIAAAGPIKAHIFM